jgi:hypothetical protein
MDAALVAPGDEFSEHTPKVSFIPDQHSVETLSAECPYQPLNMCRRIGSAVWCRYSPDTHFLEEPRIECRPTRHPVYGELLIAP